MHVTSLFFLMALVAGSSPVLAAASEVPDDALGRDILAQHLSNRPGKIATAYDLAKFTKTDGQAAEAFGVRVYTMWFEADLRANQYDLQCSLHANDCPLGLTLQRGDILVVRGEMRFERTERGWRNGSFSGLRYASTRAERDSRPPKGAQARYIGTVTAIVTFPTNADREILEIKGPDGIKGFLLIMGASDRDTTFTGESLGAKTYDMVRPGDFKKGDLVTVFYTSAESLSPNGIASLVLKGRHPE